MFDHKQYLIGYPIKKQVRFLNGPKLSHAVAQFSSCDLKTRLFCNSKSRRNGHQAFEPCLKTRLKMLISHRPDYSVRLLIFPTMWLLTIQNLNLPSFRMSSVKVVSSGHFHAFYVVFVPLECGRSFSNNNDDLRTMRRYSQNILQSNKKRHKKHENDH